MADPKTQNCDGHTFEERYVYFLQKKILLSRNQLKTFRFQLNEHNTEIPLIKIAYSQSAYIVDYLMTKYGVEKMKQLWKTGDNNFKNIYGLEFDEIIDEINIKLTEKYPIPIKFNLEDFKKNCIE